MSSNELEPSDPIFESLRPLWAAAADFERRASRQLYILTTIGAAAGLSIGSESLATGELPVGIGFTAISLYISKKGINMARNMRRSSIGHQQMAEAATIEEFTQIVDQRRHR